MFAPLRAMVEDLLAEEFLEFGASGGVYSRSEVVDSLAGEINEAQIRAWDFHVAMLSSTVALITYQSARYLNGVMMRHARRSSIWRQQAGEWRMRFHQGTLVDGD